MSAEFQLLPAVERMAREEGFARMAVAPAGPLTAHDHFIRWLRRGCHADMRYMERYLDLRHRPDLLVEGARSVICLAASYVPPERIASPDPSAPRGAYNSAEASGNGFVAGDAVARFARGRDYHVVLRDRCRRLMDRVRQVEPGFRGRAFVDSGPIMERALAVAAGLGWVGQNGCLVVPGLGSYVVLCEIVSNLPLPPGAPLANRCDECGRCAAACPTGAILPDGMIDCRRCVSYLTIEHRGLIEREHWRRMGTRIFGCDACQEACPFNRDLPPGDRDLICTGRCAECPEPALCGGRPMHGRADLGRILRWTSDDWDRATQGKATRRAGWEMFVRNAVIAAGNSGDAQLIEPLMSLRLGAAQDMEMIDWALDRLRSQDE